MRGLNPRALLLPAGLGLALLALVGYRSWGLSQAQSLEVFGEAPSFALTDQLDRPVSSDELRGKVVVANFIYTNCPDICPLLSFHMMTLQERLRREQLLGGQVQLLSFTVDPARDTPAVLREYAERFQADPRAWRFLTGPEPEMVQLIEKRFFLAVQPIRPRGAGQGERDHGEEPSESYEVMHSGRFALIDRQGRIRAWYDGREFELERVMRDVRQLLR
jgi:protein SCO1/2